METPMTTPVSKGPNRVMRLLILIIAAVVIVGAAGGVYYYMTQKPKAAEAPSTPPELKISTLQGKSVETGFYVFDETDVVSAPSNAEFATAQKGINYFWSSTDKTVQKIIAHVKPKVGMKILFAFYSPGEDGRSACYYVYPAGPYQGTCTISDISTFNIPANRGFAIIANQEFEYVKRVPNDPQWGINPSTQPAQTFNITLQNNESGWVMVPLPNLDTLTGTDPQKIKQILAPYQSRFDKMYPQNGTASFTAIPVDPDNYQQYPGNFSMIWLKLKPQQAVSTTAS